MSLQAVTLSPKSGQPAKGTIVILHGWGANAQDVLSLAIYLNLPDYQLVFPDAPFPHPYNPVGKAWYDFPDRYEFLGTPEFADRPDLVSSRQQLTDFLQAFSEQSSIPLSRTVLGGFSQGGAMTLDVGLSLPLAGLMVLSGYLHAPVQPQSSPPILMVHGTLDTVVPLRSAQRARDSLRSLNLNVRYHEYEMGHEIQPIVLHEAQTFIQEVLGRVIS